MKILNPITNLCRHILSDCFMFGLKQFFYDEEIENHIVSSVLKQISRGQKLQK